MILAATSVTGAFFKEFLPGSIPQGFRVHKNMIVLSLKLMSWLAYSQNSFHYFIYASSVMLQTAMPVDQLVHHFGPNWNIAQRLFLRMLHCHSRSPEDEAQWLYWSPASSSSVIMRFTFVVLSDISLQLLGVSWDLVHMYRFMFPSGWSSVEMS